MPSNRKTILANGEIYHVFNRGVEKRQTFTNRKEFIRGIETLKYYRFKEAKPRFSHFLNLDIEAQLLALDRMGSSPKHVEILAYCFMPNHFHFLLRQSADRGISKFVANFTNSYTKYFNTKYDRVGPLFQGTFKAVHIEHDEQLIHVSRYIHLNPVTSFLVEPEDIKSYEWSSFADYANGHTSDILEKNEILGFFPDSQKYIEFILDQASYTRNFEKIKHLTFEA